MTNITRFVYKDNNNNFYFDPENYTDEISNQLTISYEDGDMVKWNWEGKTMIGTLREEGHGISLFKIVGAKQVV